MSRIGSDGHPIDESGYGTPDRPPSTKSFVLCVILLVIAGAWVACEGAIL